MVTKRLFEKVAAMLRSMKEAGMPTGEYVDGLADIFELENPRFDRERFRTACGL